MTTYDDIWLAVLDYCKTQISKSVFSLWIEPLKLIDFNGNTITLLLASPMQEKITKSQYGTLLEQAFEEVLGFKVNLEYKLCTEQEAQIKAEEEEHIKEEIADVMVMLKQFQLYYDIPTEDIKAIMKNKVDRQPERIEYEPKHGKEE